MKGKKKSSEKDIHNLRQLLKENILTSSTANNTKYSNEFYSRTNPNNFGRNSNSNLLNHKYNKGLSFSLLKYKPKRLVNFKGVNIPLPSLGKASIDYSKIFRTENVSHLKKSQTNKIYNFKTLSPIDNKNKIGNLVNNEKLIEFKNEYILKYGQYSDTFKKFHPYIEFISDGRKRDFESFYRNISKNLDLQSQILFDDINNENKKQNNISNNIIIPDSPYETTSTLFNNCFNDNQTNYIKNKRKIADLCSDYSFYIIKFLNILFKEIKDYKNEIIKLLKINHELELKTNMSIKELDDLKVYIYKFNINKMINEEKAKESSIKKIKNKFFHKENEYLISIYKLQDEIKSLMQLLDKNKDYYNKLKDAEKEISNNKKNNNQLRLNFNKELQEKNLRYALEKDKSEELLNKLEDLNKMIIDLKEERDTQRQQEIEARCQMLKMKIIIDEKNENLLMMKEDLDHYIRDYDNEKKSHRDTMAALRTLENRIFKDENDKNND